MFKIGEKYTGHFNCSYNTTITIKVIKRTLKTIVFIDMLTNTQHRKKINKQPEFESIIFDNVYITSN